MILPLTLSSIKRGEKYLILFILFLGILMTKSMIAIALTSGYILCMILSQFFWKKSLIILPFIVLVVLFATYGLTHESVKWLSLTSRFVLMKYTVIGSLDSFGNILFWHGPNGIVEVFSGVRPAEIDWYFPRESIIDSSHNIFIDIFACYGLLGLGGSLWYIIYRWRSLGTPSRAGVMLGILFLSLNVLVISHMMLLVFLLSQSSLKENSSH